MRIQILILGFKGLMTQHFDGRQGLGILYRVIFNLIKIGVNCY